ncbi:MAG TPA: hypothetical protein VKT12_05735 [Candidatus Binataceae bacterium]|nr:hypothetical protein [Candidatus Binataceae bacterium]
MKSRLNSLSVPSAWLVANTSPAVGVAVGLVLEVGPALEVALELELGDASEPLRKY